MSESNWELKWCRYYLFLFIKIANEIQIFLKVYQFIFTNDNFERARCFNKCQENFYAEIKLESSWVVSLAKKILFATCEWNWLTDGIPEMRFQFYWILGGTCEVSRHSYNIISYYTLHEWEFFGQFVFHNTSYFLLFYLIHVELI